MSLFQHFAPQGNESFFRINNYNGVVENHTIKALVLLQKFEY